MPSDPVTLDDLRVVCSRCGGTGSIEASQSEDAKFSYQDQCPNCSSWGVVPATESQLIQVLEGMGAKRRVALMQNRTGPLGRLSVSVDEPGSYLVLRLED